MKQQKLDLLMDLDQPLIDATSFYQSNPIAQEALTYYDFLKLIKDNRKFFSGSIAIIRSETFLRKSFPGRLNEWLSIKKPNNLQILAKGDAR